MISISKLYKIWAHDPLNEIDVSKIYEAKDSEHFDSIVTYALAWCKKCGFKLKTIDNVFYGKQGKFKIKKNKKRYFSK